MKLTIKQEEILKEALTKVNEVLIEEFKKEIEKLNRIIDMLETKFDVIVNRDKF